MVKVRDRQVGSRTDLCRDRVASAGRQTFSLGSVSTASQNLHPRRRCRPRWYGVTAAFVVVAGRGLVRADCVGCQTFRSGLSDRRGWEAPVFTERTSVGLDVHARSVAAAGLDTVTGEVWEHRLRADRGDRAWLADLPGPVAVAYEAGPTGFGLARDLTAAGIRCEVAAPSKIRRAPGDRVKTDARDALLLARLLRMDDLTAVTVPSVEQEAARDLVRAREDCRGDLMRARHRLSKLLLRHGLVWDRREGLDRQAHDAWLRRLRADQVWSAGHPGSVRRRLRDRGGDLGPPGPARCRDRRDGRATASSPRSCAGWAVCAGSRR